MSTDASHDSWLRSNRHAIAACLRKDLILIAFVTLAVAAAGAALGKLTATTWSTAQLVLTPLPLHNGTKEDKLAQMLMEPLGIQTAVLICTSDEVFEETRNALNSGGKLSGQIESLAELRDTLSYTIRIEKETPYDVVYSPIILLTAKGKTSAGAKLVADTWAKTCVEAAKKYQAAHQGPPQEAFNAEAEVMRKQLAEAEREYEEFRRAHNLLNLQTRMEMLVKLMGTFDDTRVELQQEVKQAQARSETFKGQKAAEDPRMTLKWTPSEGILSALGAKTVAPPADQTANPQALKIEQINETYVKVSTELALDLANHSGAQAELEELNTLVGRYTQEVAALQAELAQTETEDARLARNVEILEEAYKDAALKREYACLASHLNQPQLQLLSTGEEWRLPRFRRAITFGVTAGMWAFVLSALLSMGWRLVLKPILES